MYNTGRITRQELRDESLTSEPVHVPVGSYCRQHRPRKNVERE